MTEAELNKYGRTLVPGQQDTDYADGNGFYRLKVEETQTSNTVTSFQQCLPKIETLITQRTSEEAAIVETAGKLVSFFEQKYMCSGMCKKSLFYYSLETTAGRPEQTCVSFVKDEFWANLAPLAITSGASAVIIFFIWCCQFALWRRLKG